MRLVDTEDLFANQEIELEYNDKAIQVVNLDELLPNFPELDAEITGIMAVGNLKLNIMLDAKCPDLTGWEIPEVDKRDTSSMQYKKKHMSRYEFKPTVMND